jgi:hypothetical protein
MANGATDTLVRLEYHSDEQGGCVAADELRRMVTDQLGHDPFRPEADRTVAITITKTEAGFQGRIVWKEADGRLVGERLVGSRSRDCHQIAANVAFAVVVQLQLIELGASQAEEDTSGSAQSSPPKTADQPDLAPATVERQIPSVEAPTVRDRPSPARLMLALGAGPAVGMGIAPEATALGRLFVVARFRRWSAEIAADGALPVTQREPDGSGVSVSALGSSVAGCGHLSVVSSCLLGRLGWLYTRGPGVDAPRGSWTRFNEVGVRLAGTKDLGRFSVSVHADGLVMLSRWNVLLNDAVVWRVPRVGGVVGFDVALRFF